MVRLFTSARRRRSYSSVTSVGADVVAVAARRDRELGDGGGVAQAEIEALRADRRDHVAGLADQRDPPRRETARRLDAERKCAVPGLDLRPCRGSNASAARSRRRARRASSASIRAASSGATTQTRLARRPGQRHQGERAMRGMELGRDVAMRPRVGEVEGERGLRIAAAVGLDAGGRAAERAPAVRRRPRGAPSRCRRRPARCGRRRRRSRPHGPPGRSARGRAVRRRAPAARRPGAGSRCSRRTRRARSRRPRSAPRARATGGRCRRRCAWCAARPPARGSAPRRRAPRAPRPSRRAARWCGCRSGAAGRRPARSGCRRRRARSRPSGRPGRRRPPRPPPRIRSRPRFGFRSRLRYDGVYQPNLRKASATARDEPQQRRARHWTGCPRRRRGSAMRWAVRCRSRWRAWWR